MSVHRNGPRDDNRSRDGDDNHEYGEDRPTGMDPDGVIEVGIHYYALPVHMILTTKMSCDYKTE
jgi:hypothetical protein